jgi:hypothetical protein
VACSFLESQKNVFSFLFICIAVGQGIYFATQAAISHGYTQPDRQKLRHMFMGENTAFDSFFVFFADLV